MVSSKLLRGLSQFLLCCVLVGITQGNAVAQDAIDPQTLLEFQIRVKQVSQFFDRFNNTDEEFIQLYTDAKEEAPSRSDAVRYLLAPGVTNAPARQFLEAVAEGDIETIAYRDKNWYAHALAHVNYKGTPDTLWLSFQIVQEIDESFKWVITGARANFLSLSRSVGTRFINPMSHEINFIDLYTVMDDHGHAVDYVAPSFDGDDLTLLIDAINEGHLVFAGIGHLRFFFLQLEGWIIGIDKYNTLGAAGGWLIDVLLPVRAEEKEAFKRNQLYIQYN